MLFEIFDYIGQFCYGFIIKNRDTMFAKFEDIYSFVNLFEVHLRTLGVSQSLPCCEGMTPLCKQP